MVSKPPSLASRARRSIHLEAGRIPAGTPTARAGLRPALGPDDHHPGDVSGAVVLQVDPSGSAELEHPPSGSLEQPCRRERSRA